MRSDYHQRVTIIQGKIFLNGIKRPNLVATRIPEVKTDFVGSMEVSAIMMGFGVLSRTIWIISANAQAPMCTK